MWKKEGLILDPQSFAPALTSHAAMPFVYALENDYRLFFTSRDSLSRSNMYRIGLRFDGQKPSLDIPSLKKVLSPGKLGTFDDSGAMSSWAVAHDETLRMYYTGWHLGKSIPFYNFIGLAVSHDHGGSFERFSDAPVMGFSAIDPYLCNSPCVLKEDGIWKMWYVSGLRWEETNEGAKHYYFIRYAQSDDGIHWESRETPCIDFASREEYAIARPCVVRTKGGYLMWYSYRGKAYKMGFAVSRDGLNWKRVDHMAEIDASESGWDSEMIAFAHVFKHGDRWWMFYNGNDYGRTGIGAASCADLPEIESLY